MEIYDPTVFRKLGQIFFVLIPIRRHGTVCRKKCLTEKHGTRKNIVLWQNLSRGGGGGSVGFPKSDCARLSAGFAYPRFENKQIANGSGKKFLRPEV